MERLRAIWISEEEEEEAVESMVSQGEREGESWLEKDAVPKIMPLSGDCPLLFRSLEQLLVVWFRGVVTELLAGG